MLTFYGWMGSVLFAICAMPQAYQCYKQKHAKGMSWLFLLLWLGGEIFTILYIWPKKDMPLLANYSLNMLVLLSIIYYKVKGNENSKAL